MYAVLDQIMQINVYVSGLVVSELIELPTAIMHLLSTTLLIVKLRQRVQVIFVRYCDQVGLYAIIV